jgi:predicted secreted hydrolase
MIKRVILPKDELLHKEQAIEWWYFNGFLESKNKKYAFMTCLFKAEKDKVNLKFLKVPFKIVYFSHSLLYNLTDKKVEKEILPFVLVSSDSFKKKELFINYFYPIRKDFFNYEISRNKEGLRVKTKFFDLEMKEKKKPLLEGGKGFIDLGEKSTYYFTYPNLEVSGYLNGEKVRGKAWHDKQWSNKGFMKDSWLWFSLQLSDNTDIVCFDYKGKKMATLSYPNNKQETCEVKFTPLGRTWKSHKTGIHYHLSWEIRIKDFVIKTNPIIEDCEMNFGFLNYWEGPLIVNCDGKKAHGFMEFLAEGQPSLFLRLKREEERILKNLKGYFE